MELSFSQRVERSIAEHKTARIRIVWRDVLWMSVPPLLAGAWTGCGSYD
jgi:hypothetical protein